jgi:hypothetical protein
LKKAITLSANNSPQLNARKTAPRGSLSDGQTQTEQNGHSEATTTAASKYGHSQAVDISVPVVIVVAAAFLSLQLLLLLAFGPVTLCKTSTSSQHLSPSLCVSGGRGVGSVAAGGAASLMNGETFSEKAARIRSSSPYGHLSGWKLDGLIAKSNDDLRQEVGRAGFNYYELWYTYYS